MTNYDSRITPARPDLAASELEGLVRADRYAPRRRFTAVVPAADLAFEPGGARQSQLLFGERFDVLEVRGEHAWGQALRDSYMGWVGLAAVREGGEPPIWRVRVARAAVFTEPSVRAAHVGAVSMNALIPAGREQDGFLRVEPLGWVPLAALAPIGSGYEADPVQGAERLLSAPYVWGGRRHDGLDCSALVQAAMFACGRGCPRDSDLQEAALGRPLAEQETPGRGDLVFWDGHVGLMTDPHTVLHANSFHMAAVVEPLSAAAERAAAAGSAGPRFRRVSR